MNPQAFIAQQTATPGTTTEAPQSKSDNPAAGPLGGNFTIIMIVGVFAIMYFFAIRPQRKEEKRKKEMLSALKKGDTVITSGGIVGSVHSIKEDTIILKVGDNTRIEVLRNAISSVKEVSGQPAIEEKESDKTEKFPRAKKTSRK
ncbi:MAG: preprotein translocase subunit YajC [Leptospiraceae bacterium]|nr:preprotein translocase subunit YajC [Leptospiraceae bacterium]MCB1305633.1 preprotein translocase subunit YajC [Leptospiraceae bacterium]